MTITPLKHIVFIAGPNGSHLRPGLKFIARLVEKFPNAYISIFVFAGLAPQALTYLETQSPSARARTRIVPTTPPDQIITISDVLSNIKTSFSPWMDELVQAEGFEMDGFTVAPPGLVIEDFVMGGICLSWKDEGKGHDLRVIPFSVAPAASLIAHIGNPEHGHGGRLFDSILAVLNKQDPENEKPIEEIFQQELVNRVIHIPGLPPFYEHEQSPQMFPPLLPFACALQPGWNKVGKHMDTVVVVNTYEFEPIAAEACKTAFTNPVTLFCVGPPVDLPPSSPSSDDPVFAFLNKAEPRSVVYIAFGTFFFPLPGSQRHLEIIVEEILQQGFKLVFTLSSALGKLSDEFIESVEKRWEGRAMFPKWVDQVGVLEHPAIHYFLSHGGWNSTTEAIVRGVPMIFWPFAADQGTNSLQVAHQHECGFELLQVRSGAARSTAYPNTPIIGTDEAVRAEIKGILEMSKGGRGAHQRANVRALGRIMMESLGEGGSGDSAMQRFGENIGL